AEDGIRVPLVTGVQTCALPIYKGLTLRVKSQDMANAREVLKAPGMVPDELKQEPRSKGIVTARKKKPKELAVITECCTGCAGSQIGRASCREEEWTREGEVSVE